MGCTPAVNVAGVYFPGWLVSTVAGVALAYGVVFGLSLRPQTRELADSGLPVFGICLGCQLIARAFGGSTWKLPYGHRGGNHPVRNLDTGAVEITSQNHGFAVVGEGEEVAGASALRVTHRNLNDGTIEGVAHSDLPVFAVQYHPEAAPGPHDSRYLFDRFVEAISASTAPPTG